MNDSERRSRPQRRDVAGAEVQKPRGGLRTTTWGRRLSIRAVAAPQAALSTIICRALSRSATSRRQGERLDSTTRVPVARASHARTAIGRLTRTTSPLFYQKPPGRTARSAKAPRNDATNRYSVVATFKRRQSVAFAAKIVKQLDASFFSSRDSYLQKGRHAFPKRACKRRSCNASVIRLSGFPNAKRAPRSHSGNFLARFLRRRSKGALSPACCILE